MRSHTTFQFRSFRLARLLVGLAALIALAAPAQAAPIVAGEIRVVDSFLSNSLFGFSNGSTAGEDIVSIGLQIPSQFFFDTTVAAPGIAPSGPTVGAGSPVSPVFSNAEGSSVLTITFGDFGPAETFQFGIDIDSFASPDDTVGGASLVGTLATIAFSNGTVFNGIFVDDGIAGNIVAAVLQVPEPGTLMLVGIAVAGLAGRRWRKRGALAA
jgi:hypothetical protein